MCECPCWAHPLRKQEYVSDQGEAFTVEGRTVDLSVEVEEFLVGRQLLRRRDGNAQLPIRLAVQLVCANEACS